jgi:hypothetical protein
MYMLYCSGGSRSMNTFNLMISMGFTQLVNMLGGIVTWKSESYPTTSGFAPLQMAVSDTIVANDTVYVGMTDTIHLTVTNRANDTLRFTGISSLAGTEFSTDFDLAKTLEGPFDYTFSIFYTPVDEQEDSITFLIGSNGGDVPFYIWRTGENPLSAITHHPVNQLKIYPNPVSSTAAIEYELSSSGSVEFIIYNHLGQVIDKILDSEGQKGMNRITWDAEGLSPGIYFCGFNAGNNAATAKIVKW